MTGPGPRRELLRRPPGWDLTHRSAAPACPRRWWLLSLAGSAQGLMPAGGRIMLFGPSGAGKSFMALDWALNIAGGAADWFGRRIRQGPTCYVVAEGQGLFHRRIAAWLRAQRLEDVAAIRFIYDAVQLLEPSDTAALVEAIRAWQPHPVAVFLDTLHANMPGGEENSAKDAGLVMHSLNYISRATGAAVVLLHHPQKHGDMERGSSALKAGMDVVLKLTGEEDGTLTLRSTKVKDGPPLERLTLRLVGFDGSAILCEPDGQPRDPGLSAAERTALETLAGIALEGGVTCSEWRESTGGSNGTFFRARKQLVSEGFVGVVKQRYAVLSKGLIELNSQLPTNSQTTPNGSTAPATPNHPALLRAGGSGSSALKLGLERGVAVEASP